MNFSSCFACFPLRNGLQERSSISETRFFNAGDNERAIEEYKKVLERYPRSELIIEAVNGIQFAQESLGREDTSNEILEEFLQRNPQAGTADRLRFRQAERLLQTGDFENAVEAFRQFIRTSNNRRLIAEAWFNLGDAFKRLGNNENAKDAYQTVITEHSGSDFHNPALFELAGMNMRAGNYQEAIELFETLARRSRSYRIEANTGIGNANLALSRYARAKEFFERATELDPDNDNALLGLAKVAMNMNQRGEALEMFTLIADRNNADAGAEAQYLAGRIHQQNRNHEAAIRAFSNVRLFYGGYDEWVSKSMLGSAESNIAVGNRVEADRIIERIIEQYPGTDIARRAAALR
jgi:tetratricopeptide (TPR) repeat protein